MNEAKILELALAAGFETDCKTFAAWDGADCTDKLLAFARLVAAAEREACANACLSAIQDCHREQAAGNNGRSSDMAFGYLNGAESAADAIRSRTE